MPAYLMAFVNVTNREQYAKYVQATPAVVAEFGGRFIARGGQTATLEGNQETRRVVLIEFPSFERAQAFYRSATYTAAKALRAGAAEATLVVVDGYAAA
jgi:uncharacterized protein (DUF1330 family)